ncbi:MAG: pilC [Noviherbaspirillum sp.]|nr:pilC [Noviherbaspirillum sp.]
MSSHYFQVRYLTPEGSDVERLFFLPSKQEVRREVAQLNGVIQSITERRRSWLNREYYSREYRLAFLKGLSFHLDVGVSAGHGLMSLIESEPHPAKRAEMQAVLEVLARGGRFSEAIAALPFMDPSIVVLLQTADASGSIDEAIDDAIAILENRSAAWKMIATAFSWLSLDIFTVVSTVFALHFYAVPWFRNNPPGVLNPATLAEYERELQLIAATSQWLMVGTVITMVLFSLLLLAFFRGSAGMKAWLQERIVQMPSLRGVFLDGALSDGFMLMSRMGKNGVPMALALELLSTFAWIDSVSRFWRRVQQALNEGADTHHAFAAGKLLGQQELLALSSHQNRDHLSRVLASMAQRRRDMAQTGTRRFIRISVVITLIYMVLVICVVFWLLSLQNTGLSGSFDELLKGGY